MPVTVEWMDDARTIVLQTYVAPWTWDDFYKATSGQTISMLNAVEHPVHIISDYTQGITLPTGSALTHARNVLSKTPPNLAGLYIVSASPFIRTLTQIFSRMFRQFGSKIYVAQSVEDALAQIVALQSDS